MQALAGNQPADARRLTSRENGLMRDRDGRSVSDKVVDTDWSWYSTLWPCRTDGDDAVRGAVAFAIEHRAMMLAVTTAACR